MNVRILEIAQRDLDEIETWIAAEDPLTAERVMAELLEGIELLASHRSIGPRARDTKLAGKGYRYLVRRGFVVFYRQVGEQLRVMRVLRGTRNWRKLL